MSNQNQATDLPSLICDGAMRAAIEIAARRGILDAFRDDDEIVGRFIPALRAEIKAGYDEAARDAKEALEVLGAPMAKASINASCILFATRAMRAAGLIAESEAQ